MKKTIILSALFIVTLLLGFNAYAKDFPGWERPISHSQLVEFENGDVVNDHLAKRLVLHQRDNSDVPTSFSFSEEVQVYCIVAPCPPIPESALFKVVDVKDHGCGSVKYIAFEDSAFDQVEDQYVPRRLELVDHTYRVCKDLKPYKWEATIFEKYGEERAFGGNPMPVSTIK